MKSRYVLCFTVCFFTTCFGMDQELVQLEQAVFDPQKYEVTISDEYRLFCGCRYHYDATLTINTDTSILTVCLPKRAAIPPQAAQDEKESWKDVLLSGEQCAEIQTKSKAFYLYAYQKNKQETKNPCSCVQIKQIITNKDGHSRSVQLESQHEMVQQSQSWNVPSLSTILLYGALPFIVMYNVWAYWKK